MNVMSPDELSAAVPNMQRAGWLVIVLPDGLSNRFEFVAALKAQLTLDPPSVVGRSLDAIYDAISNGLGMVIDRNVAIVWPDTASMERSAPEDLNGLLSILYDVSAAREPLGKPELQLFVGVAASAEG